VLAVKAFGATDPREYGADGLIELPPLHFQAANFDKLVSKVRPWQGGLHDLRKAALISTNRAKTEFRLHPGIMPSWDNTPRRPNDSTVFVGETPELFRAWLTHHLITEQENTELWNDEGLVFINAWNEWAEGACLEPDATFGYQWLAAVAEAKDLARAGVDKNLLKAEIANLAMKPLAVEQLNTPPSPKIAFNRHSLYTAASLLRKDPSGVALIRAIMNLIQPKIPKKITWQPRLKLSYQPSSSEPDWNRLTAHVHVFYLDEAAVIAEKLRQIKNLKRVIVTHPPHLTNREIEDLFQVQDLEVLELPNRGRNFGALVQVLELVPEDHSVLHLHTKRSVHMERKRSKSWFLHMVNSLLEPSYLETGLGFVQSSKENWIWYPPSEHIVPARSFAWNSNTTYAKHLSLIANLPYLESQFPYPAGGMFLASPILLERLRGLKLCQEDFPQEPLSLDGSLAHTLERFMGYLPHVLGMKQVFITSSGLLTRDPSFIYFENAYDN
jgi:lipopolysaccharide biosynthesis protein